MSDLNLDDFGEPRIKVVALPKDTNSSGNIFGGWILAQIDLAGATAAREIAPERVVGGVRESRRRFPLFMTRRSRHT